MDRVKGHNFFLSFDSFYFSSRDAFVLLILLLMPTAASEHRGVKNEWNNESAALT